jgi:hypothetical protein
MTLEEYHAQCHNLGISRGRLSTGFPFESPGVPSIGHEPNVYFPNKGKVDKPFVPDLSHMNPARHAKGKLSGAVKKGKGRPKKTREKTH